MNNLISFSKKNIFYTCFFTSIIISMSACTHQASYEDIQYEASQSKSPFYGKTNFRYMGSDRKFDYFLQDGFPSRRYKCKTLSDRFYPHTYPFRGWTGSQYYFSEYRGRILVTPAAEWHKLQQYYNKIIKPELTQYSQKLYKQYQSSRSDNIDNIINAKLLKECFQMLNNWTIEHWKQDRLNITSFSNKNQRIEWYNVNSPNVGPNITEVGNPLPYCNFNNWDEDARFGW